MQSLMPNMRRAEAARYLREVHGIPCAPATLAEIRLPRRRPCFSTGFRQVPNLRASRSRRLGKEPPQQARALNE